MNGSANATSVTSRNPACSYSASAISFDGPMMSRANIILAGPIGAAVRGVRAAAYASYLARTPRTAAPIGPARMMFARDIIGPSEEIAAALYEHAGFREVAEVAFALPFTFEHADYVQILTDLATRVGPALGWSAKG